MHDWLIGMRGGERVLNELALLYPDADLYTLIHEPGTTTEAIERLDIHTSPLSSLPGASRHHRVLLPLFPWAIERFDLSEYDLVISCSHAVAKGVTVRPDAVHVCYCLTPMRYIWDQTEAYLGRGALRALASPLVRRLRDFDVRTSSPERVGRFVAISTCVSDRIARHYGRPAAVVHPPVDTERFQASAPDPDDFYLLVGGFVPYKREDLAIEAFRALGTPLIVVGDGPSRKRLQAGAPDNVSFLGRVSDRTLERLYSSCRALLYPQEEDFGIVAVEAQAAGRPVIAFARGGAVDTVRPLACASSDLESTAQTSSIGTGIWFDDQTPEALAHAVQRFEKLEGCFAPDAIRSWAAQFSRERFRREFRAEIALAMQKHTA